MVGGMVNIGKGGRGGISRGEKGPGFGSSRWSQVDGEGEGVNGGDDPPLTCLLSFYSRT